MPEKVSEAAAIRRGRRVVMYPSMALLLLPLLVARVVMQLEPRLRYGPDGLRVFAVAFGIGFTLGWVSWSWLAPRWRVWAYARVDDVGQLKRAAVEARLLWPEEHVFSRTEIRPAWLRAELDRLDPT